MRLQWKYTIIINLFIVLVMGAFFIVEDNIARKERLAAVPRDYKKGTDMTEIVRTVLDAINSGHKLKEPSIDLLLRQKDVVDINVIDTKGEVIESLTGWELGKKVVKAEELKKVSKLKNVPIEEGAEIRISSPEKYHDHWVAKVLVPYVSISPDSVLGHIQIIFDAPEVVEYLDHLRIRHFIYILVVSISLAILISISISYLMIKPLENLTETITRAEDGDLGVRAQIYSRDELGHLSYSFNRMLWEIQVAHSSKIEALRNLGSGVAHEVRNPLNSIGMSIQYLKDLLSEPNISQKDRKEALESLDIAIRQVGELNRIIEHFLQFTRPMSMKLEVVDPDQLMEQVIGEFTLMAHEKRVEIMTNYCGKIRSIKADAGMLRRALYNIILNAIQAMLKGGKLLVTTEREAIGQIDQAVITIKDTGIGIPQENLEKLFDPYFTTKEKEGGMGLGLAITKRIIEAHKGKIEVKSKKGTGTSFTIILPLYFQ